MLRTPRFTRRGWREELNFGAEPGAVQAAILAGEPLAEGRWMGMRALFVGDAALARDVLATQADAFAVSTPPHFRFVLGPENIGLLDEPAHGEVRAMLAPAFSPARLAAAQPRIAALAVQRVDAWAAAGDVPAWHKEIKLLTLHIMVDVIGGVRLSEAQLRELSNDFADISAGLSFPIPIKLFGLTPFGRAMKARRRVEALMRAQCAAYLAGEQDAAPSLLRDMLSARDAVGRPLSERSLADNFIGLFIAGHDTTASSLSAAPFHVAATPDALAALRAEQAAVVAAHGGELSAAALAAMPVAEAVLREAWRLKPVVPVVGREAKRDVALGPFTIKAKQRTFVALNTITSGRAGAWADAPDAAAFRPERWLAGAPGAAEAMQQQMPFGAGKRMCLGAALAWAEAKTVLALVARRLDFAVEPQSVAWVDFPFPQVAMDAVCNPRR